MNEPNPHAGETKAFAMVRSLGNELTELERIKIISIWAKEMRQRTEYRYNMYKEIEEAVGGAL